MPGWAMRRRVGLLVSVLGACGCESSAGDDAATPAEPCRNDAGCDDGGARDRACDASQEQWYDGIDSDCDGHEDPRGCDATPHPAMIASQSTGQGVDLIVVQYAACGCCYGCEVALRIANAGTAPLESDVLVEVLPSRQAYEDLRAGGPDGAATAFELEQRLAPGQVSEPVIRHVGLGRNEQRHGYFIVVDPLDAIPESDESNNGLDADGSDIAVCF